MSVEAIGYDQIRVRGLNIEYLKDMKVSFEINDHIKLHLTAVLKSDESIENVLNTKNIEVYYGNNKTIFYGCITNIDVSNNEEVKEVEVEAKSMSYMLDIKSKSRSFQDGSMNINSLISNILGEYSGAKYILNLPDNPIGELLVQYEETDWEFLKRIVSKYNRGIFTYCTTKNIEFSLGIPNKSENVDLSTVRYKVYKDLNEFSNVSQNYFSDTYESDYITYDVESYEVLSIGDSINFMSHSFNVLDGSYEICDGILLNKYKLRNKSGLRQKREFNNKIIGSALGGEIIGVQGELVQVHLDIDSSQSTSAAKWFKFSTMSASSDGSGWYCMPEIGDSVKVYFPTNDEDESFAISAVSNYKQGAGESKDRMGDPSTKYLRTSEDKEVRLTPDGINISCNSGQSEFSLSSDGTLSIKSANNVNITSSGGIDISANSSFLINAGESVNISSDKGAMLVLNSSGEVEEWGANVNNN